MSARDSSLGGPALFFGPLPPALPGRRQLDLEPLDPRALHLHDREMHAVVLDHVSWLRGAAKLPEDEAGHGVVVLDRQVDAELLVEVVDRERAVDPDAPVRELLDRLVREVELVLDLADDLLEQVLDRDNTLHR